MKLVHVAMAACLFTASFDLLLNFQIGGSFRFSQILMIFVCLAAMARIIQDGRILWPRGATPLCLWLLGQIICLPLSGVISIGLEFFGLLLFTCFGMFAIVQLYGLSDLVKPLMKIYLASYVFVAGYGLLQFAGPLLFGITLPYTQQWFIHGRLARLNGFSYEPSFFGTYLIMGWITLIDLRYSNAAITQGRWWKWATIGVTVSLFLCSSKAAWLIMLVEIIARLAAPVFRLLRRAIHDLRLGQLWVRIPTPSFILCSVLVFLLLIAGVRSLEKVVNPAIFLGGSGLAGTPAHSYIDRTSAAAFTWSAIKESPFVGRSLGGVPVYLASRNGIEITSVTQARAYWGFPVLSDIFLASGLFGFIPFALFLYINTFGATRFAKRYWPDERAKWLRALGRAMIFEWLVLTMDQNVLRVYLWFHFSMVTLIAYHLEFAPAPVLERSRPHPKLLPMIEASAAL